VSWQTVLSGVDAVESWMAGQSYWIQVVILLAVLLPLGWATAGGIDRVVEKLLWPRTRRELRSAAVALSASHSNGSGTEQSPAASAEQSGGLR
jgi:hypothetical protein